MGARALPAQHLPAGHAAGDGSGAPVPVRLEPVAQPARLAALRERLASRCSRASRCRSAAACRASSASATSRTFVDLEDVMANNLDLLFPGMEIEACSLFRVTRNAITERDEEEADDLLEMIEIELRERKFAPIVRLEVDRDMQPLLAAGSPPSSASTSRPTSSRPTGMLGHARPDGDRHARRSPSCTTRRTLPAPARRPAHRRQHLPHDPRRGTLLRPPPVRVVPAVGRALPARGRRRPEGARDQDDAVPHLDATPR